MCNFAVSIFYNGRLLLNIAPSAVSVQYYCMKGATLQGDSRVLSHGKFAAKRDRFRGKKVQLTGRQAQTRDGRQKDLPRSR